MLTLMSVMFLMFAPQAIIVHRAPVQYPRAALQKGVQGSVLVEVNVDADGEVTDAHVLNGPQELRNAALRSVLDWHFSKEMGLPAVTQVSVDFALPRGYNSVTAVRAKTRIDNEPLRGVQIEGLNDSARNALLALIPLREGDQLTAETFDRVTREVASFDEHLRVTLIRRNGGVTIDIAPRGTQPEVITSAATTTRIQVGGNVQQTKLIQQPRPAYPPQAKEAGIQGLVRMNAVIGTDGHMKSLNVVSGDPALVPPAMEAVRQWVYQPTLLNGEPVEVATTIDVNFTLAK
jgi:TonB family protein